MANSLTKHIFVVDDDPCICGAISVNLKSEGFECTCFENADECLTRLHHTKCDLLITDVKMPGMSGLELLAEVKRNNPWMPVLVMSGYGDIPLAVKAVKDGAVDFVEKPLEWKDFIPLVRTILKVSGPADSIGGKQLTRAETIVLRLILQGKSNKEIAQILHRSVRTVEVHRSHIMLKFNVGNVVELVKQAAAMGLVSAR